MEAFDILKQMEGIQIKILEFIKKEDYTEDDFQNLIQTFNDAKSINEKHDLEDVLYLINGIVENHHRTPTFFIKIDKILTFFKDKMKEELSSREIYKIFKRNRRILLFLLKEGILTKEEFDGNDDFFNTLSETDEQNQEIAENENKICKIIRNDSIDEFLSYTTEEKIDLSSTIPPSRFETNLFLIKNKPTLIEYSAFCGSQSIFEYLASNLPELAPSLWLYAIHGQNLYIIKNLEEKKIKPNENLLFEYLIESIKCHHDEMTEYIQKNYFDEKNIQQNKDNLMLKTLKSRNYHYLTSICSEYSFLWFYGSCKYNYITIVQSLINNESSDTNNSIILNTIKLIKFFIYLFFKYNFKNNFD